MIHREGTASIILATIVSGGITALAWFVVPPGLFWLQWLLYALAAFIMIIILQFFRNPKRKLTIEDGAIVSPADGKVVVIEDVYEPELLKTNCKQISVFMSPLNVHKNLYPMAGKVSYVKYHPGKYLVAWHPKSSTENERTSVAVTKGELTVLFRQIAGAMARRIVHYSKEGDVAEQGGEMGFIKFGSRVDVFVPTDAEITVNIDDKVTGGVSVLARIH